MVSVNDLIALAGLGLLAAGLWQLQPPWAMVTAGGGLFVLAAWRSRA